MSDRWGSGGAYGGGGSTRSGPAVGGGGNWNGRFDRPAVAPPPVKSNAGADDGGCRWANSALRRPQRLLAPEDGGGWQPSLSASAPGSSNGYSNHQGGCAGPVGGANPSRCSGSSALVAPKGCGQGSWDGSKGGKQGSSPGGKGARYIDEPEAGKDGYGKGGGSRWRDEHEAGRGKGAKPNGFGGKGSRWREEEHEAGWDYYGGKGKPSAGGKQPRWTDDHLDAACWDGWDAWDAGGKGGKPRLDGKAFRQRDEAGWDDCGKGKRSAGRPQSRWKDEQQEEAGWDDYGKGKRSGGPSQPRWKDEREEEAQAGWAGPDKGHKASSSSSKASRWNEEEGPVSKGSKGKSKSNDLDEYGKGDRKGGKASGSGKGDDRKSGKGAKGQSGESFGKSNGKAGQGHGDEAYAPKPSAQKRSGGTGAVSESHLSEKRFADLRISSATKRAIAEGFGYELMTRVQAATVEPMLAGKDVLARARTGTGKTLAFLVPIIERITSSPSRGHGISAVILSPTRELACQIAEEAKVLLSTQRSLNVACFYGGTKISGDHNELKRSSCDILVATPGRMQDHLDNTSGFKERLQSLCFVCLDEADQLLDMGFRDNIVKILNSLPAVGQRQGALFSATFPDAVGNIAKLALSPRHELIDTVAPDEEVTPDQIEQCVVTTDMEGLPELLWAAVSHERAQAKQSHKIMCFFTTARLTQYYAEAFMKAGLEIFEIHSRKSQAHRTRCADKFRDAQRGIIFASDVLARGMDFPDVTAVIQVGIPSSRDQYIHRLGRTGRAGKSGRCSLLLCDFEAFFLKNVKDLPVKKLTQVAAFPKASQAPDVLWEPPDRKTGGQAYSAWLGYYNSTKGLGWSKDRLVQEANRFAVTIGAAGDDGSPPPLLKKTVGLMGLKGVPGLNVVSQLPYAD